MGTWIELRCENRAELSAEGRGINVGERCYSHDNAGPMEMSGDTKASINETINSLAEEAESHGWLKNASGWFCPYCVKALELTPRKTLR